MAAEGARRESRIAESLWLFLRMVKFEHTVFGLPFVLMGGFLAAEGLPPARALFWMVLAAAGARNFAMTLNRYADREFDRLNPRTLDRLAFQDLLRSWRVWALMTGFLALLLFSAWMLNPLAFGLSFVVAAAIAFYSYSKRFTSFTHFFLGFVLGCSPAGGWIAVRGDLTAVPVLLLVGVTLWVGGFDIIYGCLDIEFDERENLYSLPRRLGVRGALILSAAAHAGTVVCFFLAGRAAGLGAPFWLGLAAGAALLFRGHWIVRPSDLSRLDVSFYNLNAWVSVAVSVGAIADVVI